MITFGFKYSHVLLDTHGRQYDMSSETEDERHLVRLFDKAFDIFSDSTLISWFPKRSNRGVIYVTGSNLPLHPLHLHYEVGNLRLYKREYDDLTQIKIREIASSRSISLFNYKRFNLIERRYFSTESYMAVAASSWKALHTLPVMAAMALADV